MKKRVLKKMGVFLLAVIMAMTLLNGCGKKEGGTNPETTKAGSEPQNETGSSEGNENTGAEESSEDSGEWTGEISKIIMTYPTGGVEPTDMRLVQDAINEIRRKEAGVEIELKPVSIFEIASTCPMWIGGGEQIDLMCIAFTELTPFITQNMIEPMDQYLDLMPDVQKWVDEGYPILNRASTEQVYGIAPFNNQVGRAGGYMIAVEDLEAAGLSYEDGQLVTLDDLDEIFAKIKEAKPDVTPCGVAGNMDRASMTFVFDALGASASSGVVIGLDSTEVVNMYASPEYKNYLDHVRSWYENGYVLKDAATTDISFEELSISGALSGYFSEGQANLCYMLEKKTGRDYIHLMFNEPYNAAVASSGGAYWTIPVTAAEPEAAARFLNLMNKDSRIPNLFLYGIEGTHYVYTDKEKGEIGYPEGVDASTSTYSYGIGIYGNMTEAVTLGQNTLEEDKIWSDTARNRPTKAYGFCYDASAMTNQIIAVEAVINEYVPALTTGSADLEPTYAEFISKLEANGINEIIADKQAQFDAWLKEQ